ncbi:MAG: DUF2142 domain-containing protein [Eggerthellaceae bacterium]|nr:DUF2142 domain-containing protein [Eggerthellaceae bacterium]
MHNLTSLFKRNYIFILYCFFLVIASILGYVNVLRYSTGSVYIFQACVLFVLIVVSVSLFLILLLRWKSKPENIFLLLAFPVLLFFAMFILVDQVPDEIWHIYRSWNIFSSENMLVPSIISGGPQAMPKDYSQTLTLIQQSDAWDNMSIMTRDMSVYLPHLYIFPYLSFLILSPLNVNPIIIIMVGRALNASLFLFSGYWMVKNIPFAKVLLCVYLLNPMLIQQQASISCDSILNTVILVFIAYVIKARFKASVSISNVIILAFLSTFVVLSKFAYFPILLLLLLLGKHFDSKRLLTSVYAVTIALVVIAPLLLVLFYNGELFKSSFELIRNPAQLLKVYAKTLYEIGPLYIKEFFGMILGALTIQVWEPCFWVYGLILIGSVIVNFGEKHSFDILEKAFCIVFFTLFTAMIFIIFRDWTIAVDKRDDVLLGVQGRYFLPYALLPFLSFVGPTNSLIKKNCLIWFSLLLIFVYSIDGLFVLRHFT